MVDEQTPKQANIQTPTFTDKDKRETSFHDFDEKPEIIGKIKGIQQGLYGDQYILETTDGDITLGSYDVLKSKILEADIGKWVKIVCKGYVQSAKVKGRRYKDFDVYVKEVEKVESPKVVETKQI